MTRKQALKHASAAISMPYIANGTQYAYSYPDSKHADMRRESLSPCYNSALQSRAIAVASDACKLLLPDCDSQDIQFAEYHAMRGHSTARDLLSLMLSYLKD